MSTTPSPERRWAQRRDQAAVLLVGLVVAWSLLSVLNWILRPVALILLAVIIGFALDPPVTFLERWIPRTYAALLVYATGILLIAVGVYFLAAPLAVQGHGLTRQLPQWFDTTYGSVENQAAANGVSLPPTADLRAAIAQHLSSSFGSVLGQAVAVAATAGNLLADAALILLLAFWFVVDGRRISAATVRAVPPQFRERVKFAEDAVSQVLGGYIRGQLTMAAIIAVSAGIGCWALGVPYPAVIGVLAFFFELVPMVGPILAALPAVLISAFQPFPLILYVTGFFLVMQGLENNLLAPRITGRAVGLHPVAAVIGLVIGAQLGGIVGALFALPTVAVASVFASAFYKSWQGDPVVVRRGSMVFKLPNFRRRPAVKPPTPAP